MKKTIVLLTIVLAILAAPVFAEVTASGSANFAWMFNADDYEEQIDTNIVDINLGGTVGEYTSIGAVIEAEYDTDGFVSASNAGGVASDNVYLNSMYITQDITGALGLETPVSVALTVGIKDFDPKEYNDMAYGDFDLDAEIDPGTIMTKVSLGLAGMATLDAAFYEKGLGFNLYGNVADMADVSVYFMQDFTVTSWDFSDEVALVTDAKDFNAFGANTAVAVMDGLKLGAGFEMGMWDTDADFSSMTIYGLSAVYTGVEATTLTLGSNTNVYDGSDFAEDTRVALGAEYALNDMFSVNASFTMPVDAGEDDMADVMGYEAGATAVVDGLTYQAGYTLGSDNNAKLGSFMDGADRAGNFYIKMSASF